jgi:hypothetical protein
MKWFDVEQRSVDWFQCRSGVATTSNFDKIITPTGKPSAQMDSYANLLIAELLLGYPVERNFNSYALDWGREHEDEAIALYRFESGLDTKNGGFFMDDAMTIGASPDQRCFENGKLAGLAEIKCPENPGIHVEYMLMKQMNPKYIPQVQGQMYVSGAPWVDWFSYYPGLPSAKVRTFRDDKYISLLANALGEFNKLMQAKISKLIEMGVVDEIPAKKMPEIINPATFKPVDINPIVLVV